MCVGLDGVRHQVCGVSGFYDSPVRTSILRGYAKLLKWVRTSGIETKFMKKL
jgi:hypothetical protein